MSAIPVDTKTEMPLPSPFFSTLKFVAIKRSYDGEILVQLTDTLAVMTRFGCLSIPSGFISDGASIPEWARKFVGDPYNLEYLAAAIVHDALYRKGLFDHLTRAQADLIFRDLLWDTKVPVWKTRVFYSAVRCGGGKSYKKVEKIN